MASATFQFLEVPVAQKLVDKMFASYKKVHLSIYDNALVSILFNLCFSWLERKRVPDAVHLLERADEEWPKSSDPYISTRIYLLRQAFIFLSGKHTSEALENISVVEKALLKTNPNVYRNDVHWLAQLHIPITLLSH